MSIMIRCTLLHKRIYLIQEEHGFEVFSNLEYRLKLLLQRIGISVVDNKLACRNRIERQLKIFQGCFNRERLPGAGWAIQKHIESLAFSINYIVKGYCRYHTQAGFCQ